MTNIKSTISKNTPRHRRFTGVVIRTKAQKSIGVEVEQKMMNKKYRKQYTHTANYLVHDENALAKVGDRIIFEECRPISKTKRWRLLSVIKA